MKNFFVRDVLSFGNLTGCNLKLNWEPILMSQKTSNVYNYFLNRLKLKFAPPRDFHIDQNTFIHHKFVAL